MTGKALICQLKEHIPIEGADRIVQVNMFGETIITQKNNKEGTVGLLFDCETQLSHAYASANNMYRHSELNSDKTIKGYLDDNARVKPIKLKGVKCSALFMPLTTLDNCGIKVSGLTIGEQIDKVGGVKICQKYINPQTKAAGLRNKQGKARENLTPTFKEHFDTDQLERNLNFFNNKDHIGEIIITEKLHGTSGRCGYLKTIKNMNLWYRLMYTFFRLLAGFGWEWNRSKLQESYNFVVGSRRVVKSIGLDTLVNKDHYYDDDIWTAVAEDWFGGKLNKGETVYFEIVGNLPNHSPIMPGRATSKLKEYLEPKEYNKWLKHYGEELHFNYYNTPDQLDVYVYRITSTNEDGISIDYTWDQVKNRCDELDVKCVPELARLYSPNYSDSDKLIKAIMNRVERINKKFSPNFDDTPLEGVCVRVQTTALTPKIFKSKTYPFKVLEGIIKSSYHVDMEEAN